MEILIKAIVEFVLKKYLERNESQSPFVNQFQKIIQSKIFQTNGDIA